MYDFAGDRFPYKIFRALDKDTSQVKERASGMLRSLNEPLNAQTSWKEKNQNIKTKLKQLMVFSQIAEAARPTEESFDAVKKVMSKVTDFELKTAATEWEIVVNEVLKKEKQSLDEESYE